MSGRFRMLQVLLGVAMLVQIVGFIYDIKWHNDNPSATPASALRLLHIHSGIYISLLIALPTCFLALRRWSIGRMSRTGVWVSLGGGLVSLLGNVTDFWAHGQGYEKDIYHYLMYAGAGIMLLGYLVVEMARISGEGEGPGSVEAPERAGRGAA